MRGDLFGFDGTGWRPTGPERDVRLFGDNVGIGSSHDDTNAFQLAADTVAAEKGTLLIPRPQSFYQLSDQVLLQAASGGSQLYMNVRGSGADFTQIKWNGGNNKSIFKSYGWKQSEIIGLNIRLTGTVSGVIGFDVDHDATRVSTSHLLFRDVHVSSDAAGVKTSCVGWRIGHGAGVEFSYMDWDTCSAEFTPGTDVSCLGWVPEHNNGLILNWRTCMATGCLEGWTGFPTTGSALTSGSAAWTLVGCGGTGNTTDIRLRGTGAHAIIGGRFENGKQFLQTDFSGNTLSVLVAGTEISGYTQGVSDRFFNLSSGIVRLQNLKVVNIADSGSLVQLNNASVPMGLVIEGGAWDNADPFVFDAQGTHRVIIRDVQQIDATGAVLGWFKNRDLPRELAKTLTYSATIATNSQDASNFLITATNGTAFTISTPTNPATGATLTYDIKNSSGGAHGVITWGAGFLNGGAGTVGAGAFAGIANGKRRTISFYYDGTNWIELYRTADQ